jgi:hypothetical protein
MGMMVAPLIAAFKFADCPSPQALEGWALICNHLVAYYVSHG